MTAEKILQSDVLDILFEGKNKSYGAYELRRHYDNRMKKALAGTFTLIALLGFTYLMAGRNTSSVSLGLSAIDSVRLVQIPKQPAEPEKPKPQKPVKQNVATANPAAPLIVPDEQLPETKMPDIAQLDSSAISTVTKPGDATTIVAVPQDPASTGGTGTGITQVIPETPSGPVEMSEVDQLPEYPGGKDAMVRYMVNNLTSELESGIKYAVRVMFIINEEGHVSGAQILNSDDERLNSQVLRAIKRMKQWKPGIQNGHAVAVRFVMPVTFMGAEE